MRVWLAALTAFALCAQALSVRGRRGGDVLAAGAPALAPSSAGPVESSICGLPSLLYVESAFAHDRSVLGRGGFGEVLAMHRQLQNNEVALPLERRALANAQNDLAVKMALPEGKTTPDDATREAALGLLICSGAACPAGAPFPAFIGTLPMPENKNVPALVTERAIGTDLSNMLRPDRATRQAAAPDWLLFLDAYALPSSAPAALRNLDGVLAVAAQMALAVARLAELSIVHHDIKPANTIVGRGGVRVFDWGLACLSAAASDDVVNAAAAPAAPFRSAAEHACSSLRCHDRMSTGGSLGFMSPAKLRFFDPCTQGACTAAELTSVDLFAVGASLLQLLAANENIVYGRGLLGDEEACPKPEVTIPQKEKEKKQYQYFGGLLASYFSLDGVPGVDWASEAAKTASRRRIYSVLALASDRAASDSVLGAESPLSHFRRGHAVTELNVPYCFAAPASGPNGLATAKNSGDLAALRLMLAPPSAQLLQAPARWTPQAVEPHLLELPATSTALAPLLDLLRKLLAYHPRDGFTSALDAVREIESVRELLAKEANAPAAFAAKLACLAKGPPRAAPPPRAAQAQAPQAPAPAQQRAPMNVAACRSFAALAKEQVRQRDQTPLETGAAARRPDEFDIAVAYRECTGEAREPPPPGALQQQPAFAAIVHRHACHADIPPEPVYDEAAAPASVPLTTTQLRNGAPDQLTLEKLPFALTREATGVWQQRAFGLKCDVVLHNLGLGVWVHWTGGNTGMGYVVHAFDTSDNAPERRCNMRYLTRPERTSCKALDLIYATPRSSDKGGTPRPRQGLLKLYSGMAARLPQNALADAIRSFKEAHCGDDSDVAAFRHLLEAAAARTQPAGWQESWAAALREANAQVQHRMNNVMKTAFNDVGV